MQCADCRRTTENAQECDQCQRVSCFNCCEDLHAGHAVSALAFQELHPDNTTKRQLVDLILSHGTEEFIGEKKLVGKAKNIAKSRRKSLLLAICEDLASRRAFKREDILAAPVDVEDEAVAPSSVASINIEDYPDELFVAIMQYLNIEELCAMRGVCKLFSRIGADAPLWLSLYSSWLSQKAEAEARMNQLVCIAELTSAIELTLRCRKLTVVGPHLSGLPDLECVITALVALQDLAPTLAEWDCWAGVNVLLTDWNNLGDAGLNLNYKRPDTFADFLREVRERIGPEMQMRQERRNMLARLREAYGVRVLTADARRVRLDLLMPNESLHPKHRRGQDYARWLEIHVQHDSFLPYDSMRRCENDTVILIETDLFGLRDHLSMLARDIMAVPASRGLNYGYAGVHFGALTEQTISGLHKKLEAALHVTIVRMCFMIKFWVCLRYLEAHIDQLRLFGLSGVQVFVHNGASSLTEGGVELYWRCELKEISQALLAAGS